MTDYSFDTFKTDARNGDAARICREVAELRFTGDTPVVLVAPQGGGKSHLLWSIVKHLRSHDGHASLAMIMAREFPDRVRQLASHPAPIQNGSPAVLLIDELERFADDKQDLEDVVRVFLQNGHPVIAASRVHPDQLTHFDESFRALLQLGQVVDLNRAEAIAPAGNDDIADLRSKYDALCAERDDLEQKLAERAPQIARMAELQRRLDAVEKERDQLLAAGDSASSQMHRDHTLAMEALREELASVAVERDAARDERDRLEEQFATRAEGAQENLHLAAARDEAREAQLRAETALAEAEAERESTEVRLQALETQAGNFLARINDGRYAWNENAQAFEKVLDRLQSAITKRGPGQAAEIERLEGELGDSRALATSYRVQLDQERAEAEKDQLRLDAEIKRIETAHAKAEDDLAALQREFDAKDEKLTTAEFELEKARRQNALAAVELDALRHEAATQVARANIQAGEMENRAKQLQDALDIIRETGRAAAQDSLGVQQTVEQLAQAARNLEARLRTFNNIALPYVEPDDKVTPLEPILFEPSSIKSAAETLDTLAREWKALEHDNDQEDEDDDDSAAVGQSAV